MSCFQKFNITYVGTCSCQNILRIFSENFRTAIFQNIFQNIVHKQSGFVKKLTKIMLLFIVYETVVKGPLSGLRQSLSIESPLKRMNDAFNFMLIFLIS